MGTLPAFEVNSSIGLPLCAQGEHQKRKPQRDRDHAAIMGRRMMAAERGFAGPAVIGDHRAFHDHGPKRPSGKGPIARADNEQIEFKRILGTDPGKERNDGFAPVREVETADHRTPSGRK